MTDTAQADSTKTDTQSQKDAKATDAKATDTQGQATTDLDVTKLSKDQLGKVLEHPEFFKQERVKRMLEAEKELKTLKENASKQEEESLEKSKKFEDLAKKRLDRLTQLESQVKEGTIRQALISRLVKENPLNLDSALKLIDHSLLEVDDSGTVKGADKAIEALKQDNPFLFKEASKSMGTATTNNGDGQSGPRKWTQEAINKLSQEDYAKYSKEIHQAMARGEID